MTKVVTDPWWREQSGHTSITVYALRHNKRPIGFAPWPEAKKAKKRKKGKKP
jgi:hypothetical protein